MSSSPSVALTAADRQLAVVYASRPRSWTAGTSPPSFRTRHDTLVTELRRLIEAGDH
jgi:hypothetical protein